MIKPSIGMIAGSECNCVLSAPCGIRRQALSAFLFLSAAFSVSAGPFAPSFELDTITASEGNKIQHTLDVANGYTYTEAVGDVNGDGFGDYTVSFRPQANEETDVGVSREFAHSHYLIHNLYAGRDIYVGQGGISAATGTVLKFEQRNRIRAAGDFNGDGLDDWLYYEAHVVPIDPFNAARVTVVYGQSGGYAETVQSSEFDTDQSDIIYINNDQVVDSVAPVGDFNDDGYDDLLVETDNRIYLVYGRANGGAEIEITTLPTNQSLEFQASSGRLAGIGDVNGDGYDDFGVGYLFSEHVAIIFGGMTGLPVNLEPTSLDGTTGISITPTGEYIHGSDVNNDGYSDILVGRRGGASVIYGQSNLAATIDLDNLGSDTGYSVINPNGDSTVSAAGDLNDDGIEDWMIGAEGYSDEYFLQGRVAVIFGSADPVETLNMNELDGRVGFTATGSERSDYVGRAIASAGDTNADGIDDVIIATENGTAFILFGREDIGGPLSPTNPYAVPGPGMIDVTWDLSTSSTVNRYEIIRDEVLIGSVDATVARFSDDTIAIGETYRYEIVAIDVFDQRSAPTVLNATNPFESDQAFPAIGGLVYSDTAAEIFWSFGNANFRVYRDNERVFGGAAQSYFDDEYTTDGHDYFVEFIASSCCDVNSPSVRSATLRLPEQAGTIPPARPTGLRGSLYSATALEIFWNRVERGVAVDYYEIALNGDLVGTTDGTSLFLDSGVEGLETLNFSVTAFSATGLRSGAATYRFPLESLRREILPKAAIFAGATALSESEVELEWGISRTGTDVVRYDILLEDQVIGSSTGDRFLVTGLPQADRFYEFSIVGVGFDGNRAEPATIKVATLGGPLPATDVSVLRYSPTVIELFWTRSAGVTRFVNYEIYRDGELIDTKDGNSYLDTGLLPGVTYTYTIVAVSGTGANERRAEPSVPVVVTTWRIP